MPLYHPPGDLPRAAQCQPRRAGGAETQDGVARWHPPPRDGADGIHAALGRAGAATATASDPISWGTGAERDTAQGGGAGTGTADGERTRTHARRRLRPPAGRECEGGMHWAQLLKRVFDIDIECCPHGGGQLKLIAAIEDAAAIARILTRLGLAAQPPPPPPPRAPARRVDLFQAA